MGSVVYTARLGSASIAENVPYETLLTRLLEYALRAALARAGDATTWEHEDLRRRGLQAIEFFRGPRALWSDPAAYEGELAEARREGDNERFEAANEVDPTFFKTLDVDLRARWRKAGYDVPSLAEGMKVLFKELQADLEDRAADARQRLAQEILAANS